MRPSAAQEMPKKSVASGVVMRSGVPPAGAIMAAPGVVFSAVFGIPLVWAVALIGVPTVIYTMVGGVQAVAWADVKQMVLIVIALFAIMVVLIVQMPVNPDEALKIAGATGWLRVFDFSFDMSERYTFWSGVIGGTFLMLSYFGTDQSQVQRYLAALHERRDEPPVVCELREHRPDLVAGRHDRQAIGRSSPNDVTQLADVASDDVTIEEQQGRQRLVLH